jgi:Fe-S-cluster containining protein
MAKGGPTPRQRKLLAVLTDGTAPLPRVTPADAVALTRRFHEAVDETVEARAAYASESGFHIACSEGCSACCRNPIVVSEGEALAVARWLSEPARAAARHQFEQAYPAWHAELGAELSMLSRREAEGRVTEAERIYEALRQRRVMCAFNQHGSCTIYPVRPTVCRHAHAVDTSEHCDAATPERPRALEFPPADELLYGSRPFVRRLAAALGRPHTEALCQAVHRLLEAPAAQPAPPGRNTPCPCGSGAKYKRCCG